MDHITGGASSVTGHRDINSFQQGKMNLGESTIDVLGRLISRNLPVAGANLQNARRDFKYAKKNDNAHIINSRSEIKNKDLNDLMDTVGIPKNSQAGWFMI